MYADRGIKLDAAVTMLKKAIASDPQNYAFLDSLAWAYYKQGQYAMAEDYERCDRGHARKPSDRRWTVQEKPAQRASARLLRRHHKHADCEPSL